MFSISLYPTLFFIVVIIIVVRYHLRSTMVGWALTLLVRLFLSKHVDGFKIARIGLFPMEIDGLTVIIKSTTTSPELRLSWKRLSVHYDLDRIRRILTFQWLGFFSFFSQAVTAIKENSRIKFVSITLEDFHIHSPDLKFQHALHPSPTTTNHLTGEQPNMTGTTPLSSNSGGNEQQATNGPTIPSDNPIASSPVPRRTSAMNRLTTASKSIAQMITTR